MNISKVFWGMVVCLALANNVSAANKTHVTDLLGAGNSRLDTSVSIISLNITGSWFISGFGTAALDGKISGNEFRAGYRLGITDQFDIGISQAISDNATYKRNYVFSSTTVNTVANYEGVGDIILSARYLLLDKRKDSVSWVIQGFVIPPTAPSDDPVAEEVVNGTLTTSGKFGKSGNGYRTALIGGVISIPYDFGDVYLKAEYTSRGLKNQNGTTTKIGSDTTLGFGLESMLSDKTTLRPYIDYTKSAAGYFEDSAGRSTIKANSIYQVGIDLIQDLTSNISLKVGVRYYGGKDQVVDFSSGNRLVYNIKGYGMNVTTQIFF